MRIHNWYSNSHFRKKGLSTLYICRLWYIQEVLELVPCGYWMTNARCRKMFTSFPQQRILHHLSCPFMSCHPRRRRWWCVGAAWWAPLSSTTLPCWAGARMSSCWSKEGDNHLVFIPFLYKAEFFADERYYIQPVSRIFIIDREEFIVYPLLPWRKIKNSLIL